jgi:acetylornithine deacetylase
MSTKIPFPGFQALALMEKLVGMRTVSRDSNLDLIEWVASYLKEFGATTRIGYDAGRRKANLLATIGDPKQPGILLSGHSDVVPVDGQDWDTDPFTVFYADGKAFGRGTADMKGFIAVALSLAPAIVGAASPQTVHFALSYDEELGCLGTPNLIELISKSGIAISNCIVGEPTSMRPVVGHKGSAAYRCCVRGKEAHAALTPQGVNAIHLAAKLISRIDDIAHELQRAERHTHAYTVPYSTISANRIGGGIAGNVIPKDCEFSIDLRHTESTSPDAVLQMLEDYAAQLLAQARQVAPEAGISFEQLVEVPGFDMHADSPLVSRMVAMLDGAQPGHVDFGSEAGFFRRLGCPTVLCGPGSIEQAHKPNEFVTLRQLHACEVFLTDFILHSSH